MEMMFSHQANMTKCVKPSSWSAAFTLVYDAWNRLVIVKDGETVVMTCYYDGMNRRVKKVTAAETRLFYFNNAWQCLEEYLGSETLANVRYFWGLRYVDDLIMRQHGSTHYVLADPNWNVVALTNTSGVVVERMTYAAFGKINVFDATFTAKTPTANWSRTFTGQVLDKETGLMLYRNRVYHPTLGRFVQRDPIGYTAGDVNLYRYVGNVPNIMVDDLGNQAAYAKRIPKFLPMDYDPWGRQPPYGPLPYDPNPVPNRPDNDPFPIKPIMPPLITRYPSSSLTCITDQDCVKICETGNYPDLDKWEKDMPWPMGKKPKPIHDEIFTPSRLCWLAHQYHMRVAWELLKRCFFGAVGAGPWAPVILAACGKVYDEMVKASKKQFDECMEKAKKEK